MLVPHWIWSRWCFLTFSHSYLHEVSYVLVVKICWCINLYLLKGTKNRRLDSFPTNVVRTCPVVDLELYFAGLILKLTVEVIQKLHYKLAEIMNTYLIIWRYIKMYYMSLRESIKKQEEETVWGRWVGIELILGCLPECAPWSSEVMVECCWNTASRSHKKRSW